MTISPQLDFMAFGTRAYPKPGRSTKRKRSLILKKFNDCVRPGVEEVRALFGNPDFLLNLETLVKRIPDYEEKIAAMRERMKRFADMRAERVAKTQVAASAS